MKKILFMMIMGFMIMGFSCVSNVNAASFSLETPNGNKVAVGSTLKVVGQHCENENCSSEDILWEISDPDIASVDQTGLITGLKDGETVVSAKYTSNGTTVTQQALIKVFTEFGTFGTCSWDINASGVLSVYPEEGLSCTLGEPIEMGLDMSNLQGPWSYNSKIQSIRFTGAVKANQNSSFLFSNISNLKTINFANFNTSDVENMSFMFESDSKITSLDLSGFDTSKVTSMSGMFAFDSSLTSINLSNFNTSNVVEMDSMFAGIGATELNLSSFSTSKVTSMDMMFASAPNLTTIKVSDLFDTSNVVEDSNVMGMFEESPNLVGGAGTTYDSNHVNVDYAHIDGGVNNPGYFTSNTAVSFYDVTFETNGGSTISQVSVRAGDKVTKPSNPTKTNYDFDGWYKDAELTEAFNFNDAVTSNITLYAKWQKKVYIIHFETNGGSSLSNSGIPAGEKLDRFTRCVKKGYKLVGWYKDAQLTKEFDKNEPIFSNITLYAKWQKLIDINLVKVSGVTNKVYNGKNQTQNFKLTYNGNTLIKGKDYDIEYKNNKKVGTATIIIKSLSPDIMINGRSDYTGTRNVIFKITKANNTMTLKTANKKIKYKKLKKKKQVVTAITVKNAQGKVTYSKVKGSKKIKVNKTTGKITVKKKTKKGTYKIKVKVTANGNANYKALSKTVTVKIKVK